MTFGQFVNVLNYLRSPMQESYPEGGRYIEHVRKECDVKTSYLRKVTGRVRAQNWRYIERCKDVPREVMLNTFYYHLSHMRVGSMLWRIVMEDAKRIRESFEDGSIPMENGEPVQIDPDGFMLPESTIMAMSVQYLNAPVSA